jgi:hypothetical protein
MVLQRVVSLLWRQRMEEKLLLDGDLLSKAEQALPSLSPFLSAFPRVERLSSGN